MLVLGVDPGSLRTGWGVVDVQGSRMRHVASGVVRAGGGPLAERLLCIADALDRVLGVHRPGAAAVETIFFAKNSQSAIALGQARGVALLCAARAGVQVFEYTAGQIKQAVTRAGRADKAQVQAMVRMILGLEAKMPLDQSDALAAALCHASIAGSPISAAVLRGRA